MGTNSLRKTEDVDEKSSADSNWKADLSKQQNGNQER